MKIFYLLLFFSFLLTLNTVYCQSPIEVNSPDSIYHVKNNIRYIEDPDSQYGIKYVAGMSGEVIHTEVANFLISHSAFWIKFIIKNNTNNPNLAINISFATLDSVTLYGIDSLKKTIDSLTLTENQPFWKRPFNYQTYIFNTNIPKGHKKVFFARIKASEQILVPISVANEKEILQNLLSRDLVFGIYAGLILVMILYNLALSFFIKGSGYIYYVFYILFVGLSQAMLQGYTFRFFWPYQPQINAYAGIIIPFLNGIAAIEFVRHFLNLKTVSKRMNLGMLILNGFYSVSLIFCFTRNFILAQLIIQAAAFLGAIYILIICISLEKRKYKPAKILLIAWSVFLFSVIIFVLRNFGILPYNNFTFYALQIGSSVEAILLSIALADKINVYRREQSIAKAEALRTSKENERLVKEQNINLEKEVKARTSELEKTNGELNETLQQLKLAQAKLVDSEKMASLGQLTAGVAHEINNPINFVTSNIKPLELDIKDIFEVLKKYEDIDFNGNVEGQLQAIEHYKKQLDTEFIAGEITSLLNGIREGADRTAAIVKNLKNFSRIDQSDLKYVHLNEGIESTLMLVRNSFPTNLKVQKNLGDIAMVECSPGKINQVFMNIITNAVQAMKAKQYADGGVPVLGISSWQENDSVKISIKDNGTGMNPEVVEKIYEPFFTTKDVGEGTGLGMSIVKGIMDHHEGTLEVKSAPGEGTEFIITLPQHSNRQ